MGLAGHGNPRWWAIRHRGSQLRCQHSAQPAVGARRYLLSVKGEAGEVNRASAGKGVRRMV